MAFSESQISSPQPDRNLKLVVEILDALNVKYWVNNGTLLGLVRNGHLLPWDTDVDIGVDASSPFPIEALDALIERGFQVSWSNNPGSGAPALKASRIGGLPVDIAPYYDRQFSGQNTLCREWIISDQQSLSHDSLRTQVTKKIASSVSRLRRLLVYGRIPTRPTTGLGVFRRKIELTFLDSISLPYSVGHYIPTRLIYPLKLVELDGYGLLSFPADSRTYLEHMYGDDWETEKRTGVWHAFLTAPPLRANAFARNRKEPD